jgi:MFS transporter, MHS family, proline/betaine transporter
MSLAIDLPRQEQRTSKSRIIAACTIGNALEFYDFVIFSFFARTIGALFFPSLDPTAQLLLAFATYGVGFLMRPLGGVVLGAYADRKGRKKATVLTLMMMAVGTGMIGLAPVYADAGVVGAVIVVLGRLIQGFSAGGEVGASTTLLAEHAPPEQRGFFGRRAPVGDRGTARHDGKEPRSARVSGAVAEKSVGQDRSRSWQ